MNDKMVKVDIVNKIKKNPYIWLVATLVLAAGIFFRTYSYHDWLRFNADQGRDASIVSDVIDGKQSLPLLGPKAGGTTFQLGPISYYFQIASAKIFGDTPDKMAYPDLFTGILCIPLLFLFLRKYFDARISFALSAIFSLSQFAIRWARFAWNPNSTPFWTLLALYALHELVIKKDNRKFLWAVLAGLAVGIGVQLHTMLLLSFPITLIIVFVYLLIKKNAIWKYFLVIFAVAFFLNIPQVVHEYATNGSNIQAFFGGIKTKEDNQHSIMENLVQGNSSVAQIVPDILTGYEISDNFKLTFDGNHNNDVAVAILGALFTLGGAILAIKYYKKEENVERKAFLAILFVYTVVSYLIFIKLAFTISVRMYLVLFFVPFFLLGFWLRFLSEKLGKYWNNVLITISIFFILSNLFFIKQYFEDFASYYAGLGTVDIATLGGMEKFANFITSTSKGNSTAYVSGDKKFLFVSSRSISYLIERSNISLSMVGSNEIVSSSITKFYYIARENKLDNFNDDPNYKITKQETYGKFSIMMLEKK